MRALRRRARGAAIISFSLGVEFGRCVVGMLSRRRAASFVYGRKVRLYCNVCIVIDGPSVRLSTMLPFLGRVWDEDGLLGTDKDALWQAIHLNRLLEQTSVAMLPSKYAACSLRPRRENTTLERPSMPSTRREWRFMQPQNMKLTAIISHSGPEATPFAGNTPTQQCKQPIPLMRIIVKALPREPLDTSLPDVRKQSDVLL